MTDSDSSRHGNSMLNAGDAMRRRVLGDAHVDKSRANATAFGQPLQDLVTEYCWGAIWNRPGLEPGTRSMLNIAMLTALGKSAELRVHVRGALNNGVTVEQIQEVLLQAAVYCGAPAALEASRAAQEVISER